MMHLGAFFYPTGYHIAAWRHPLVPTDAGVDFAAYHHLATLAESAAFDFIFLPDSSAFQGDRLDVLSRSAVQYVAQLEPLTLISALAPVTERIGLVASASTTYGHPYDLARKFASLDHISGGRTGWNLVTSQNPMEAANFADQPHPPHAQRYARAEEFIDVAIGLWDTWSTDAFPRDKATGRFFNPDRLKILRHQGPHFSVRGPLNVPRSPQGQPVLVQSGSSAAGRRLAGRAAEVVFTAQSDLDEAIAFTRDLRRRAAGFGRAAGRPLVLSGILPFVGATMAEAELKRTELEQLIDPEVGLFLLERQLGGIDLSSYPLDGPLPPIARTDNAKSRRALLIAQAERERLTLRQLFVLVAGGRGHLQLTGTPGSIADEMERWYKNRAVDGFTVMAPMLPQGLEDFVEMVIPELVRRGLFRKSYAGDTLREHLGLPEEKLPRRLELSPARDERPDLDQQPSTAVVPDSPDAPNEVSAELDVLTAYSGIAVPPGLRAGAQAALKDLRAMTTVLRQVGEAIDELAGVYRMAEMVKLEEAVK